MPSQITPPLGGVIAPGLSVDIIGEFIGPIEPGSFWDFIIITTPEETTAQRFRTPWVSQIQTITLGLQQLFTSQTHVPLVDGKTISVTTEITTPSGTLDQGTTAGLIWQNTANLPQLLTEVSGGVTNGAFTDADRDLLNLIRDAVYRTFTVS